MCIIILCTFSYCVSSSLFVLKLSYFVIAASFRFVKFNFLTERWHNITYMISMPLFIPPGKTHKKTLFGKQRIVWNFMKQVVYSLFKIAKRVFILRTEQKCFLQEIYALYKKWSFSLRISSVNGPNL